METMPKANSHVTRQNGRGTSSSTSRKKVSHARRGMFSTAIGDAFAVVDVSRGQVAQILGVTEAAVSYWLAGQRARPPAFLGGASGPARQIRLRNFWIWPSRRINSA